MNLPKLPQFLRNPRVAFPIRFAFWLAVLGQGSQIQWVQETLRLPLREGLAASAAWAIGMAGIESHARDTYVFAGSFSARVIPDCDGVVLIVLFLAAVFSFPGSYRLRMLPATLAGLAIVLSLNWLRVVALVLTGYFDRDALEFSHVYIWQGVLILGTVLVWIGWANQSLRLDERTGPRGPTAGGSEVTT